MGAGSYVPNVCNFQQKPEDGVGFLEPKNEAVGSNSLQFMMRTKLGASTISTRALNC